MRSILSVPAGAAMRRLLRPLHRCSPWDDHAPVREELFSVERLEAHARGLALAQTVTSRLGRGEPLVDRLGDNRRALLRAYRGMVEAVEAGETIPPAAEWLIDNFHVVEKQIREIQTNLSPGYYRQLPKLADGPFVGYPRVFGMAWAFVAHTDSRFDIEKLLRYTHAYQEVQPLTIGELWAISITLRIVLIETLRRLAQQTMTDRAARADANRLADRLLGLDGGETRPVALVLAEYNRAVEGDAFAVQLLHRLRDQAPRVAPALAWLDLGLAARGTCSETVVRDVHRRLGASNVTVRNIITSLRLIADVDWNETVERISLVDDVLAAASDFLDMDFSTRNLYRSAVETLARGAGCTELEVAAAAVRAAETSAAAASGETRARRADPGYHLLAGGRGAFEAAIGFHPSWRGWPVRLNRFLGLGFYGACIALLALALLAGGVLTLPSAGLPLIPLVLLAGLGLIPALDAAVALVNRAVPFGFGATLLPGLDLRGGVPPSLRTLIAVPTLLTDPATIAEQIERLEIHHLASPDGDLYYALLSDWADAGSERVEGDEALLALAAAGIAGLNRRHQPGLGGPRFLLLHRRRRWSDSERRWIGWERKRGKLHELNRLLRGAANTSFVAIAGAPPAIPPEVRYVITLDADTRLPRDTARRLIGKMAHPLNHPRLDPALGRVVEGYAVLQPRVTPSLPVGREGSAFQRIFSSLNGINPYVSAVSDVYQDLFGEGSYVGKGIYDIDFFEAALAGRVPDATLLSHDLFEGVFARAGLASDIEVVEDFPARYDVSALRHHRWARGDWQLLPWIFGFGPNPLAHDRLRRALPTLGRWKMLDNLRCTLSAPAAVLALVAGWMLPLDAALAWTAFVLATIIVPTMLPVIAAIPPCRPGITLASHLRALLADLRLAVTLSGLTLIFLAHQSLLMGDAILRTLWRLFVLHRHLLEWIPAAQAGNGRRLGPLGFYARMGGAPLIGLAALALVWAAGGAALGVAVPVAALWLLSPLVAYQVSRAPSAGGRVPVPEADRQTLRLVARRTWRFFETFVTAADQSLPPDNFQEDPVPTLAHRTSPTNLGLYLLSVASAHDFGWIGTVEAVERLEATLATMDGLTRYRGHFLNWYDTTDLRPLDPKYVSSVDSGNLAGHLLTLANACREWHHRTVPPAGRLAGVADALELARDEAIRLRDGRRTQTVTWPQLDYALAGLSQAIGLAAADGDAGPDRLGRLAAQADLIADIARALVMERDDEIGTDLLFWARACQRAIQSHARDQDQTAVAAWAARLDRVAETARQMALAMDFGFLLDHDRKLLSIGFLVAEGRLDPNCYDLLASEARLASFVAIAKGDVPARHWFRLGRAATPVGYGAALISWSGSMFEYLMPSLVMRAPADSLLDQTSRLVVRCQIDYATRQRLPWGISESAYNLRDLEFTYQYSNFGVPGLGLKRGLGRDRVIAPYATALAAMVEPHEATLNLTRLAALGGRGRYGFYEALDYTPSRLPEGETVIIVRAFMAHHQGMTIIALADTLFDGAMRRRFHAEPIVQATELLLQERMPRDVSVAHPWAAEVTADDTTRDADRFGGRRFAYPHQPSPATHLLSNGRLTTMLTAAGSGYTNWGDLAVTRWREDATRDDAGSYLFLRDIHTGVVWSAGWQPTGLEPDDSTVAFREDRAEFSRRDGTLTTMLEVLISAEDDAEVRRLSLSNAGPQTREIDITSYAELVLAPRAADLAHRAFSNLFVETEYLAEVGGLVATRRRRSHSEPEVWAGHLAVVDGDSLGPVEIETDRARFLGRGHSLRAPLAVIDGRALSNSVGTVLDPIFALRRRVRIAPGATVRIAFWTLLAETREGLLACIDKHRDTAAFGRAATLAWTQGQVELHHLGITTAEAGLFQRLAGHVLYAASHLRPGSEAIQQGGAPQSGLWPLGISGDRPIVLVRIAETEQLPLVREILLAHEYWRMKRLAVDLVILNEHPSSYVEGLQSGLETLVHTVRPRGRADGDEMMGRVFLLRADQVSRQAQAQLGAVARAVLVAQRGSLFDQLDRRAETRPPDGKANRILTRLRPSVWRVTAPLDPPPKLPRIVGLEFFNGLGGFAREGTEYVTILEPGQSTPAPWVNVIANPEFGFQVSAEGGGYSWALNSRDNQLTPWSNDPLGDPPGEVFYLRDDETGVLWSPTALPIRDEAGAYVARHGRGYSQFSHTAQGIETTLWQTVAPEDPVKLSRLVLRNLSGRVRALSVTAYVEWVLGPSRPATLAFVSTAIDPATGAMFARNPWRLIGGGRVAFADWRGLQTDWTGDRGEFIGRNGSLAHPAALARPDPLSNRVGAGIDPCGALRTRVSLPAGGIVEIVFLLGEAADADAARRLVERFRTVDPDQIQAETARLWDNVLGRIQVRTPDRSMDILLNGWLLYQTLACRVWARSAFYQASGAYGFRDQLQDGMALASVRPAETRAHLLRAAGRQFLEGDVQHWWLPWSGQGVRGHISDDRVWLAVAVAHYVGVTGDDPVLDEVTPFLDGPLVADGTHEAFFVPTRAERQASLFEHCVLALDSALTRGRHGLPLFGTGDWNDGMNRVGENGAGESVWLGWLLYAALAAFAPLAERRGQSARAEAWREQAEALREALERDGWDGGWYRRGFFDDGTPLGSQVNEECRIDQIAQSWAVLSGGGERERASRAMAAVEHSLIRVPDRLALLFAPPFAHAEPDPGYIKAYPPGIRENGGQYTHAALWSVMAFAALGDGDRAAGLFSLLNPINQARTRADVLRYKVEPYVVAADVYAVPPHLGRGGWTWYTGSAGWMQRAGIEAILGVRLAGDTLGLDPCIPKGWAGFDLTLRHGAACYQIQVNNRTGAGRGIAFAALDGVEITARPLRLGLIDDGRAHQVEVQLG